MEKGLEYFFAACTAKFSLLSSLTYDKAHRDVSKCGLLILNIAKYISNIIEKPFTKKKNTIRLMV